MRRICDDVERCRITSHQIMTRPNTAQHSTAQHSTALHSTAQQHSTAVRSEKDIMTQHRASQHSKAQHLTSRHIARHHITSHHIQIVNIHMCMHACHKMTVLPHYTCHARYEHMTSMLLWMLRSTRLRAALDQSIAQTTRSFSSDDICIYPYIPIFLYSYIPIFLYLDSLSLSLSLSLFLFVYIYIYIYICVYVCIYVCVYIYIYVYVGPSGVWGGKPCTPPGTPP